MKRLLVMFIVLAGLLLRLAWAGNPGCTVDTRVFANWMRGAKQGGIEQLLHVEQTSYPPLSIYLLWGIGELFSPDNPVPDGATIQETFALRYCIICVDLLIIATLYVIGRRTAGVREAQFVAFAYAVNPVAVNLAGWWGQIEAWFVLPLILGVWWLSRGRVRSAWASLAVSLLFKQPALIVLPVFVVATDRWLGLKKLLIGLFAFLLIVICCSAPIVIGGEGERLIDRTTRTTELFPWISLRSYNLWYLITPRARQIGTDFNHDHNPFIAFISFHDWGLYLFGVVYALVLTFLLSRASPGDLFAVCGTVWIAYFVLTTRIHARYLFPSLVFLHVASYRGRGWLWLGLVATMTMGINVFSRACELTPTTCPGPFLTPHSLSMLVAATNLLMLICALVLLIRGARRFAELGSAQPAYPFRRPLRIAWAAFLILIAVSACKSSHLGRRAVAVGAGLLDSLEGQLAMSEGSVVALNIPREIKACPSALWERLPLTTTSVFPLSRQSFGDDVTWLQYQPWQTATWETCEVQVVQYAGRQVSQPELVRAGRRAERILTVDSDAQQVYVLAQSIPVSYPGAAELGNGIHLLDAIPRLDEGTLALELSWYVSRAQPENHTIFVHVLGSAQTLVGQHDGMPGGGLLSLAYLGETQRAIKETRLISVAGDPVTIQIGVYDLDTGTRLPVSCGMEFACTEDAVRVQLN